LRFRQNNRVQTHNALASRRWI